MTQDARNPKHAFTLVELLLGMSILALVIGSVYTGMKVGMEAYLAGQYSMELYQSARIGLREVAEELRFALSPNAFWHPADSYRNLTYEELINMFQGPIVQEEDPGAIVFQGNGNSVTFVRKVYQLNRFPPFDLQECSIYVDQDRKELVLEILRSLLAVKQMSWFYRYQFQLNLAGQVIPFQGGRARFRPMGMFGEPPIEQFIGDYGTIRKRYLIASGIHSIQFRYSSGKDWERSWSSQELVTEYRISPQSPNFDQMRDVIVREKGPPQITQISLELENGDVVSTATYIPAGRMSQSGGSHTRGRQGNPAGIQPPRSESPAAIPGLRIR